MSHATCYHPTGSGQLERLEFNPLSSSCRPSSSCSPPSIAKTGSCGSIGILSRHVVTGPLARLPRGCVPSWSRPCRTSWDKWGGVIVAQRSSPLHLRSRGLGAHFQVDHGRDVTSLPFLWFGQPSIGGDVHRRIMGCESRALLLALSPQGGKRAVGGLMVTSEASLSGKVVRGVIRRKSRGGDARAQAYDADAVVASVAAQKMGEDPVDAAKRIQVSRRVARAAELFKRLGVIGFWSQLVCTFVSAGILAFSLVLTGKATSVVTLYLTAAGICAAFLSVFWSFGYTRLSIRLREGVGNPSKAPPRSHVVRNLTNGLMINLIGMGAAIVGMESTVGVLVGKALTSSAAPMLQANPSFSPVLALDVFLVQASTNTVLSHFIGMILTLMLLRSVTLSQPPPDSVIPRAT
eukprot:TRINITY_DN1890_c1_g1_i2.p1 TRINITY_DN1890_c1_g1~~TRINITY_DN1890_c1_g1_i2.p1  ORF type:complete len:406 (-),score=45.50 TRINITY_DN1890_c1_g1_i2:248-1465(-)